MKKIYNFLSVIIVLIFLVSCNLSTEKQNDTRLKLSKKTKKTTAQKAEATRARLLHDFNMQKNPLTGKIPLEEKKKEFENSLLAKESRLFSKAAVNSYISRGPSNFGGRTRALQVDISDATGETMLAGAVSGGVFRTTNGGDSWVKVSPFNDIHNVTTLAQDPRQGFQNIWYYGTGEYSGNSAGIQEQYIGHGVWKSTDSGLTWQQMPATAQGEFQVFDNFFDFVIDSQVHPITGDLFVSTAGKIYRLSGVDKPFVELDIPSDGIGWTDIEITSTGIVYATIDGGQAKVNGVYKSLTGGGGYTKIASNGTPAGWGARGRITLAIAPSDENIVYVLYNNGQRNNASNRVPEADLWQYNSGTDAWINYSAKLPNEPGGDSDGNDPFSIQGAYDLVVSVKPDNSNFVVIGGTNAYKIEDIVKDQTFRRIGGYAGPNDYKVYGSGSSTHHPDIHAFEWDLIDSNIMFSGTDGGLHKTNNITSNFVNWNSLNNNYLTYQYYHVNMTNALGDDVVIGGAQDNGTTIGGTNFGLANKSLMNDYFGGDGASVAITKKDKNNYVTYASTQNGSMFRGNNNFLTTIITPSTGVDANDDPEYYPSQFVTYFHKDPDNASTIYYASNFEILRTNDAENVTSDTWTSLGRLPSGKITTFATTRGTYDPASSYLLIGGNIGDVYRLKDPKNITDVSSIVKITPPGIIIDPLDSNSGQYTSGIAIHPTNPDIVIVVYASYGDDVRNIFISDNATSDTPTWTQVERNLDAHSIRSAAITEVNNVITYFVGTARGLYKSNDPATTDWALEGNTVMGIPIVSGLVYRPSDNILLVGTHGNGMYQTNLSGVLSVDDNTIERVNLAMYPNPAQFKLNFVTKDFNLTNNTKFSIYSVGGKEVKKGTLNDKTIDVSSLSKGIYIVNLKYNNTSISKKFIKN